MGIKGDSRKGRTRKENGIKFNGYQQWLWLAKLNFEDNNNIEMAQR